MQIDLNSDLGEGVGDDAAMLGIVSSANVACGFHAGEPRGLLGRPARGGGAGRRGGGALSATPTAALRAAPMEIAPEDLTADVIYQIGALQALARAAGTRVSYVKPHGALYNTTIAER